MKLLVGVLCSGLAILGPVQSDLRPIVEQALDQPMELVSEKVPLGAAIEHITDQTGVAVTIAAGAADLLPYGPQTQVTAELRNISLREGLASLLGPLGMTFAVTDNGVEIFPNPGLARLGRRATWPELRTLEWLRVSRFDSAEVLEALRGRVQFQVAGADPWLALAAAIRKVGAGAGDEVLEIACESLGWTWYPWGEQVVVVSLTDQSHRQLQTRISVRKSHRPLVDVLREVSRQSGVTIRLGDGAGATLPARVRESFTLFADNVTAEEALEEIATATGLRYRVQGDAVVLAPPDDAQRPSGQFVTSQSGARRDPYVAKIVYPVPGGQYDFEFLLRESDLSPEVNALRTKLIGEANDVMGKALRERFEEKEKP